MSELYLIGNAHIDPVWLWRWQDGYSEVLATFRSALDRLKEFPETKFTSACSVYYQWIEKTDPGMFEEIRQRVAEGRWCITGGWYLQPDCNIPDGESYVRHALAAQKYFKEKFGITVKTGYNVDSFGHNASLPKILKSCGMDNYVFMRPSCAEQGRNESLFCWTSDDGSSVTAYRIPERYCITTSELDLIPKLKQKADEEGTDLMAFYGVGNHGGGLTIELIDAINRLGIPHMHYATPDEYFADIKNEILPIIDTELQHHARGCYSAESSVKKQMRKCEQNLLAAERFCTMAKELTGMEYPSYELKKAWENVLFNQFHDIVGGCSVKPAYEDASYLFGEAMSISEKAINNALQTMAWHIDTLGDATLPSYKRLGKSHWVVWEHEELGCPVVAFNSHPWQVRQCVHLNLCPSKITDSEGREIPFQLVRGEHTNWEDKYNVIFDAEVPAYGYAVYRVFIDTAGSQNTEQAVYVTETTLENDRIRVEFDKTTGEICSFYCKDTGKYITDSSCKAVVLDETDCDTWAHDKISLGDAVGEFSAVEFSVVESGPVRGALKVVSRYNDCVMERIYSLVAGSDEVKVSAKVDFCEKHRTLKLAFPLTDESVLAKVPYGTVKRAGYTGEEPCGSWIASGDLCIANDGKYAYDTCDGYMRLTILRTSMYADHFGQEHRDDLCEYMDMGESRFCYTISPYRTVADSERRAAELNFGLRHISGSFHKGNLPEIMECAQISDDNIMVTAIKKAEDSDDIVLRFCEMDGKEGTADIKLFAKNISLKYGHNQLKTVNMSGEELNSLEW